MTLRTFAFVHAIREEQLRAFRDALPDVEFLVPEGKGLPEGLYPSTAVAKGVKLASIASGQEQG